MSAGKGDAPRPVDPVKYGENYDRIFQRGVVTLDELKDAEGFETDQLSMLEHLIGIERAYDCKWPKPYTRLDAIAREGCHAAVARPMLPP